MKINAADLIGKAATPTPDSTDSFFGSINEAIKNVNRTLEMVDKLKGLNRTGPAQSEAKAEPKVIVKEIPARAQPPTQPQIRPAKFLILAVADLLNYAAESGYGDKKLSEVLTELSGQFGNVKEKTVKEAAEGLNNVVKFIG